MHYQLSLAYNSWRIKSRQGLYFCWADRLKEAFRRPEKIRTVKKEGTFKKVPSRKKQAWFYRRMVRRKLYRVFQ